MRFLLTTFALFTAFLLPGAETLVDFAVEQPGTELHQPEKKEQRTSYTQLPGGRTGLRCDWDNAKAGHTEFLIRKSMRLPEFDQAMVTVELYLPEPAPIRRFCLRLRDRDGEIHQLPHTIEPGAAGWRKLQFAIDPAKATESWGGGKKANHKIDFPVSFIGFAADFNRKTGKGFLGIGKVELTVTDAPPLVTLRTGSGTPIHVLKPGEEKELAFEVINRRPEAIQIESLILQPGERKVLPLPPPRKYGIYYPTLEYREAGKAPVVRKFSYAYMPPAGPTPGRQEGFLFGVCTHLRGKPAADQERESMAAAWCGAKVARDDISWGRTMPTPDAWNFQQYEDFRLILEKEGIELAPILQYPPSWSKAADWVPIRNRGPFRPDYSHWANFVGRMTKELRGKVRFIEIWNEPDHPGFADFSNEEYIQLLNIGHGEIKKAAPEVKVLTGGVSGLISREQQKFFKMIIDEGKYDIPAFHGHGSLGGYRYQVKKLREYYSGPWYANETALSAIHIGEEAQAVALFQKFLYSWANGAMGYNWYDLRNDGTDPGNNEHNFGLITHDFQPKAAYPVYNMLANTYKGGAFVDKAELGPSQEGYFFRDRKGALLLAGWSNDGSGNGRALLLSGVSGAVSRIDLFGNETQLRPESGFLVLESGNLPYTIRFAHMRELPRFAGELAGLADSLLLTAGERKSFRLTLKNPTGKPLPYRLNLRCPAGLSGGFAKESITVPAGKSVEAEFELAAAPNFLSSDRNPAVATVEVTAGSLWKGTLDCPIRNAVILPDGDFAKEPTFVLDNISQVIPFVTNAPDTAHLFWKGPQDLSAKIRLCRQGDNLLLRAEVTDDVHHQPNTGAMTWAGDNIQMALQLPGQSALWEIGLTLLADHRPEVHVWMAPDKFDPVQTAKAIQLEARRDETKKLTFYEAKIPFAAIGLTQQIGKRGFRFNLIVNDNDGQVRESCIGVAPGIAESKTPQLYPMVHFR